MNDVYLSSSAAHEQEGQHTESWLPQGITEIVPFLHQLSDHVDAETGSAVSTPGGTGAGSVSGADVTGVTARDGGDRVRLDAERQILLTMLLAHTCSEHDATPRTFVEQVLCLYEAKVLDSIQFLFDLGLVPRVAPPPAFTRAALVEAVRRQVDNAGGGYTGGVNSVPLALETWSRGVATAGGTATDGLEGDGAAKKAAAFEAGGMTALGARILSTSRYRRDFEEEGLIARGSFGHVYRTRHRLDGTSYAIKKVVFRGMGVSHPRAQAVMREVQCLAQLDHRNVVRYHTSWLESSWVENGMGCGNAASSTGDTAGIYGMEAKHGPTAAPGNVGGIPATMPHGMLRALAAASISDAASDDGDMSLRARLHALVPAHLQPQLIRGVESMVRLSDSASESSQSGWGWGGDSDASGGGAGGKSGAAWRRHHAQAKPRRRGSSLLGGNSGGGADGYRRTSSSPQVLSPRSPLYPFPASMPRDRGFSCWSAEDAESETSKWSEAGSSNAGGRIDFCDDLSGCSGTSMGGGTDMGTNTGELLPAKASTVRGAVGGAGFRTSVGVVASSSPQHRRDAYTPTVVRRQPHTFRHPSIDLDDLVSFGKSAETEEGIPERVGDSYDERRDEWRELRAAGGGTSEGLGCSGRGQDRRRHAGAGNGGRYRAESWARARARTRQSVSPDGMVHYPVTLYIQMTLCPGDTLQDWLRKRNARLASEAEDKCAGVGVLFGKPATCAHSSADACVMDDVSDGCAAEPPQASRIDVDAESVTSASKPASYCLGNRVYQAAAGDDGVAPSQQEVSGALPPPLPLRDDDSHDDGVIGKPLQTPATSPRTDPATSESSHESHESDEPSRDCSYSNSVSARGGGMRCPPPTRETSGSLPCGFLSSPQGGVPLGDKGEGVKGVRTSSLASPARSESSGGTGGSRSGAAAAAECEWTGEYGSGRVDLHESLGLFRQLVDGVAHVHSKGIIHRDIKPENVFVGEDGSLKIGDFGLSRPDCEKLTPNATTTSVEKAQEAAAIIPRQLGGDGGGKTPNSITCDGHTTGVGTASYASPEQLQGHRYGLRSDMFSLGLLLMELCCCFTTTHERAAAFQSMRSPSGAAPAHLAERSPDIAALAELLCRTTAERRPSAAEAMERLDRIVRGCGCRRCCSSVGEGNGRTERGSGSGSVEKGGEGYESDESGGARLREELAAKTRIVEEQEVLIGQLQRKLTELSRNSSPAVNPVVPSLNIRGDDGSALDMEALKLGLSAIQGRGRATP